MGWIGDADALAKMFHEVGVARTTTGAVVIHGGQPVFGLGGDEVVIDDTIEVVIKGERKNLVALIKEKDIGGVFCLVL